MRVVSLVLWIVWGLSAAVAQADAPSAQERREHALDLYNQGRMVDAMPNATVPVAN